MGPQVNTATIRTVLSTSRVDLGSFSSRLCTFRRTHTSADPIRLLCIRLALRLTFFLPLRFAPSARLVVCVSPRVLWLVCWFSSVCIFWDERGGGITPMGPQVDKATIRTVLSTSRVDLGSFSSRWCTHRRTHTSADPIRLLCIRLALSLTFSLPSRFAPSTRHVVCVSPRSLWLSGDSSCDNCVWDKRGGLTRQQVGPPAGIATITAVMSANRANLGSFSSRCYAFRRTHTRADSIRLLYIRLALPLALSLPSRLASSARLGVGVPPRALWLAGIFLRRKKICAGVVGTRIDWVLKGEGDGMTIPLLQYVARFDGGGEIVGLGGGGYKKSRPWCSLFFSFPSRGVVAVCTCICSQEYVHEK